MRSNPTGHNQHRRNNRMACHPTVQPTARRASHQHAHHTERSSSQHREQHNRENQTHAHTLIVVAASPLSIPQTGGSVFGATGDSAAAADGKTPLLGDRCGAWVRGAGLG